MTSDTRLLLFEPNAGGHHAGYVEHLLRGWRTHDIAGRLLAAVSPALLEGHPALHRLAGPTPRGRVDFAVFPEALALQGRALWRKGIGERRLLRHAIAAHRPAHVLAMYGDHTQFALAAGLRPACPTRVSLLLLRVSHHRSLSPPSVRTRVTGLRKRALLRLVARSPHTGTLFSADPAAVDALRHLGTKAAYVPDPVLLPTCGGPTAETRVRYGISTDRRLLVLYGALAERKGVLAVLDALYRVDPAVARRLAVLLAGPVQPDIADRLPVAVATVMDRTNVEIRLHDAFLDEAESCAVIDAADVVLAPYLDHAGTSSVLIRAAGAGRPVITQDRGLMAEQVRTYALGRTVDPTDVTALAAALTEAAEAPTVGFDSVRARAFAESQTPDRYAQALFQGIGLLNSPGPE